MLKFAGLCLVVAAAAAVVLAACRSRPLERGLAGELFISTARPAMSLAPGKGFRVAAGWVADVIPESEKGEPLVRVWFALYHGSLLAEPAPDSGAPSSGGKTRLAVLLAEVEGHSLAWSVDARPRFPVVREYQEEIGPFTMRGATYVLPPGAHPADARWPADPLADFFGDTAADWRRGSLVRRYTAFAISQSRKVIVEYREPLPHTFDAALVHDIQNLLGPDDLLAFERRARASFSLSGDPAAALKQSAQAAAKPGYPPEALSRRSLALMLGSLRVYSGD